MAALQCLAVLPAAYCIHAYLACCLLLASCLSSQVLEFVCFKERLERSHTYALTRCESAILTITQAAATAAGAAAAAVAAAVRELPLGHLDSIDWRGMRFNDDYTTRLPWLPPIAGPRHLVVLLWWEQQHQQAAASANGVNNSSSNGGAAWWRQVAAAEADVPQAAELRVAMSAAAQQRWLLPQLLQAALLVGTSSSSSSGPLLQQLLGRYAAALGHGSLQALEQEVQQCFGAGEAAAAAVAVSRRLQLLDAAVFISALKLQVGCCLNDLRLAAVAALG